MFSEKKKKQKKNNKKKTTKKKQQKNNSYLSYVKSLHLNNSYQWMIKITYHKYSKQFDKQA